MADPTPLLPTEVHPLALEAYRMYSESKQKTISPADLASLKAKLEALQQDVPQLYQATVCLGATALYIETLGGKQTRDALIEMCKTHVPLLSKYEEKMAGALQDTAQAVARHFEKLSSQKPLARTAPKIDEEAPKGSIPLRSVIPNPALRPPPRRK